MPTVSTEIDVCGQSVTVEADFEIWCGICGNGICGNTSERRNRPNHFTTYCEKCLEKSEALELERDELLSRIDELEQQLSEVE